MENETIDCFNRNIERGDLVVISNYSIHIGFFIKNIRSFQYYPINEWLVERINKGKHIYVSYMKYYSSKILRIDREYFENNILLSEDKENYKIIRDYVDGKQLG